MKDIERAYLLNHFLWLQARRLGLSKVVNRCEELSRTLKEELRKEKEKENYIQASQELQRFYNERRAKK